MKKVIFILLTVILLVNILTNAQEPLSGLNSLFNGRDLTGWKIPDGDGGHWKVLNGVIDYDGQSEAEEKHLWTENEFEDFILYVEWRIKSTPFVNHNVPIILTSGEYKLNENGERIRMSVPDSDSGILFRGSGKTQINIWCWPIGSGELYGYRNDLNCPPEIKRSATPLINADKNIGEWNSFKITLQGNVVNVELNGHHVIVDCPLYDLPKKGPIGLQHHGAITDGKWTQAPGLIQFRNIYIQEL